MLYSFLYFHFLFSFFTCPLVLVSSAMFALCLHPLKVHGFSVLLATHCCRYRLNVQRKAIFLKTVFPPSAPPRAVWCEEALDRWGPGFVASGRGTSPARSLSVFVAAVFMAVLLCSRRSSSGDLSGNSVCHVVIAIVSFAAAPP